MSSPLNQPPQNLPQSAQHSPRTPPQGGEEAQATDNNIQLEFITHPNLGEAVDSTADFFNNLRIGDAPIEGPAYTTSISAFTPQIWEERMDALRNSSVQHAHTLTTKQRWEKEAIDMHNGVWSFVNEHRRATGVCGCGNNVVYTYLLVVCFL